MTDTSAIVVALIGAVPATVAAILGLRNGRKADRIHVLVNSNLDAVKVELVSARAEILALKQLLKP